MTLITARLNVGNTCPPPNATAKLFSSPYLQLPPPLAPIWVNEHRVVCFLFMGICFLIYIIEVLAELWILKYDLSPTVHFYTDHKYKVTVYKMGYWRGKQCMPMKNNNKKTTKSLSLSIIRPRGLKHQFFGVKEQMIIGWNSSMGLACWDFWKFMTLFLEVIKVDLQYYISFWHTA